MDDGPNTYAYVHSNPLIFIDPNGLEGVYGLGGGPYSQVNYLTKAAKTKISRKSVQNVITVGATGLSVLNGSIHLSNGELQEAGLSVIPSAAGKGASIVVDPLMSPKNSRLSSALVDFWTQLNQSQDACTQTCQP